MVMQPKINTKFGTAKIYNGRYYITSRKEGNNHKYLHRLIYEDHYGVKLPPHIVVHHIDGNPLNNDINNLKAMTKEEHTKIHHSGRDCSFYGKHFYGKLNGMYGKKQKLSSKLKISKHSNNSGYYRVSKKICSKCKQGFTWVYSWYENNKRSELSCTDINGLKKKVIAKGLDWIEYSNGGVENIAET